MDRDLTHTGLYAHHLTPTSSSFTIPSSLSSLPDNANTSIHQQSTSCTETCAPYADRDHTETQEVSSHDVMDGTSVSRTALQSMSLDQTLHSPYRLHFLHYRIMQTLLFINNLPHVQKHAHHMRIGIIQRHRKCLRTTLWMGHRCPVRLFSPCHWTRLNRDW